MSGTHHHALLVSDFNISNLAGYLNNDPVWPVLKTDVAPYGQVMANLLDSRASCWRHDLEFAVIWTRPEGVIESFRELMEVSKVSHDELLQQVDEFCSAILKAKDRAKSLFVPTWSIAAFHMGQGLLDLNAEFGVATALMRMNLRLIENLSTVSSVFVLDAQKWLRLSAGKDFNPRLWYLAKIPFSNEVFSAAAADIKTAVRGIAGGSRKLIVADLDDTLWGGTVGEIGWEKVKVGGHDPVGEAYADFQRGLRALKNRGVILGLVSKNEESTALAAIDNHPEMALRRADFSGWRINWNDKATNLVELAQELNLGLDSVVFIDNSPIERARVRETLPTVLVPEWPEDPRFYAQALFSLNCFDKPSVTLEDRERPTMYLNQRLRTEAKSQSSSFDEWLQTLSTTVTVERLCASNLDRASQLLNKTNQFNLNTRRMSEAELNKWAGQPDHIFWTFRVKDRFGDSGLTGLLSLQHDGKIAQIEDFVLSCRVMGRRIEETMLYVATSWAMKKGLQQVTLFPRPTPKNKPIIDFLNTSSLLKTGECSFCWNLNSNYPSCPHILLEFGENSDCPSAEAAHSVAPA